MLIILPLDLDENIIDLIDTESLWSSFLFAPIAIGLVAQRRQKELTTDGPLIRLTLLVVPVYNAAHTDSSFHKLFVTDQAIKPKTERKVVLEFYMQM